MGWVGSGVYVCVRACVRACVNLCGVSTIVRLRGRIFRLMSWDWF